MAFEKTILPSVSSTKRKLFPEHLLVVPALLFSSTLPSMLQYSKINVVSIKSAPFNVSGVYTNLPSKRSASLFVSKQRVSPNSILISSLLWFVAEVETEKVYVSSTAHALFTELGSSMNLSGRITSDNFQDLSDPPCSFINSGFVKFVAFILMISPLKSSLNSQLANTKRKHSFVIL